MENKFNEDLNNQIEKLNASVDSQMPNFSVSARPEMNSINNAPNNTQYTPQTSKKKLPVWLIITLCLVGGLVLPGAIYLFIMLSPIHKNENGEYKSQLGSLQDSQKSTQMKSDMFKIHESISSYRSENSGRRPTVDQLNSGELGRFKSVDDDNYIFAKGKISEEISEKKNGKQVVWVYEKATCTEDQEVKASSSSMVISKKLSTGEKYCLSL